MKLYLRVSEEGAILGVYHSTSLVSAAAGEKDTILQTEVNETLVYAQALAKLNPIELFVLKQRGAAAWSL